MRVVYLAHRQDVRVVAGGRQRGAGQRRTESRVRWKSAMLTLVVPESGSVAAALRAMVDAGRNFNDAGCAGSLREVCWGLVVMGRLKELGAAGARCRRLRGDVPLIRLPARCD